MKIYQEIELKYKKVIYELGLKRFLVLEAFIICFLLVLLKEVLTPVDLFTLILDMVAGVALFFIFTFYFYEEFMKKGLLKGVFRKKELVW